MKRCCAMSPKSGEKIWRFIFRPYRAGNVVIEADKLRKHMAQTSSSRHDLCPSSGRIVGVIGPTGAGKLRCFDNHRTEKPDGGTIRIEDRRPPYVDQSRTLDPKSRSGNKISGGTDLLNSQSRGEFKAYVGSFNFSAPISIKSQHAFMGERNRVHLAKMLKESANVLLLMNH